MRTVLTVTVEHDQPWNPQDVRDYVDNAVSEYFSAAHDGKVPGVTVSVGDPEIVPAPETANARHTRLHDVRNVTGYMEAIRAAEAAELDD